MLDLKYAIDMALCNAWIDACLLYLLLIVSLMFSIAMA